MKRLLAMLLLITLTLTGCVSISLTPVQQSGDVELPLPLETAPAAPSGDSYAERTRSVTLYYISADQQQLAARARDVQLTGGETLAEKVIRKLLEFEETATSLRPVAPEGTRLNWMEQSQGVVTLDLSLDASALDVQEMCWMEAAIANTLTELPGVDYVNVLIDGREESARMLPSGTLSHMDPALWALSLQRDRDDERFDVDPAAAQIERDATLYFAGWQDDRLLPEVRRVTLDTHEFAEVLIEALAQGPRSTAQAHAVLPEGARLMYAPDIDTLEDGRRILKLAFEGDLLAQLERDNLSAWQMFASLTLTLCRFVPELDGLRIWVNGESGPITEFLEGTRRYAFEEGVITPAMFDGLVGRVAKLYFADPNGALCAVERLMDRQSAISPRALLEQLIEGPHVFDANAAPVMPDGVTGADLLGIRIEDGTALVNLSSNFYRLCQGFTPDRERNLIYAMVNTLCELEGVDRARFYVAGAVVDTLVSTIYIRGALLPDVGAVG